MEEVCQLYNLEKACKKVKANKGNPGIDGMTVNELLGYLRTHEPEIRAQLLNGTYQPKPVLRVEIPKPDGGVRKLGIPCVVDRLVQQAVLLVLQPRWDPTFSEFSYGFRPDRSAHQAIAQAQDYVREGYRIVVDMDLEKVLRPRQSRHPDGSDRETGKRQAHAEAHPGLSEVGRAGPWTWSNRRRRERRKAVLSLLYSAT